MCSERKKDHGMTVTICIIAFTGTIFFTLNSLLVRDPFPCFARLHIFLCSGKVTGKGRWWLSLCTGSKHACDKEGTLWQKLYHIGILWYTIPVPGFLSVKRRFILNGGRKAGRKLSRCWWVWFWRLKGFATFIKDGIERNEYYMLW